jgi:glycosyltransferase involved in cell wall biosynthesis
MAIKVMTVIARMNVGGPAKLIDFLDRELMNSGFEHVLVTGYCGKNEIDYLDSKKLIGKVLRLQKTERRINLFYDLFSIFQLIKIIKIENPNIIHTHTAKAGVIGRIAKLLSYKKNIRVIHTFHGHLLYGYFGLFKITIFNLIERILANLTDVFVAVSNSVKSDLQVKKIGLQSNWKVIYPGVEIDYKYYKREFSNSPFCLLWIGRFSKIKNPLLAIQAFETISKVHDVKLVMIGDGELFEMCKKYSQSKNLEIEFVGWSNNINEFIKKADLLILTSLNEGMPLVILEAAALFIPTLATNVGGISEFITDYETGFLSDPVLDKYVLKLNETISNRKIINKIGTNARQKIILNFGMRTFCAQQLEVYKATL